MFAAGLRLDSETAARLRKDLDLIINSSGLTDFNPDLRTHWLQMWIRRIT